MTDYRSLFVQQAGSGITGFEGIRYQRGNGFFGRLLSSAVYPLLQFLGKKAAGFGANLAKDIIVDKKDFKTAAKERLKETGREVASAGIDRANQFIQTGKGLRRKMSKRRKSVKKRRSKKSKVAHLIPYQFKKKTKRGRKKKSIKRHKKRKINKNSLANLINNAKRFT